MIGVKRGDIVVMKWNGVNWKWDGVNSEWDLTGFMNHSYLLWMLIKICLVIKSLRKLICTCCDDAEWNILAMMMIHNASGTVILCSSVGNSIVVLFTLRNQKKIQDEKYAFIWVCHKMLDFGER